MYKLKVILVFNISKSKEIQNIYLYLIHICKKVILLTIILMIEKKNVYYTMVQFICIHINT